jgi:hypothetical protein
MGDRGPKAVGLKIVIYIICAQLLMLAVIIVRTMLTTFNLFSSLYKK